MLSSAARPPDDTRADLCGVELTLAPAKRVSTRIGAGSPDRITLRGYDLSHLLGNKDLGDVAFLLLRKRLPTAQESRLFNAMLVALIDHGLTPSALAARLTYLGAPEALQGALAAGLLGVGSRFVGSIEDAARMLQEGLSGGDPSERTARRIVRALLDEGKLVPGVGHPIHRTADPRALRLFELAEEEGVAGRYVRLIQLVATEAGRKTRRHLPVNAAGAIAAVAAELGFEWRICRAFGLISRVIGLVAHLEEELEQPIAMDVWSWADAHG